MARARQPDDIGTLTEGAMVVALSVVLGNMRLLELPNGGSIAFGTLPILLFGLVRGFRPAFAAGWCAGIAHALSGGTIVHPAQFALDYGVAYASLACVTVFGAGSRLRMSLGVVVAMAAHLACFVASGVLFFAQYAGAVSPVLFSLVYNASTVVPEALIVLWALPVLVRAYARSTPAHALRAGLLDPSRVGGSGHTASAPAPRTSVPHVPRPALQSSAPSHTRRPAPPQRAEAQPTAPKPRIGIAGRPAPLGARASSAPPHRVS